MNQSEERQYEYQGHCAYQNLQEFPQTRADRVATHYLKCAQIAMQLQYICDQMRVCHQENIPELRTWAKLRDQLYEDLKTAHFHDLGIKLSWKAKLKDNRIAQFVNRLTGIARQFGTHQSIRQRISNEVNSTLKE